MVIIDESAVKAIADWLFTLAEPPMKELASHEALVRYLEGKGVEVEVGVAGLPTAFVATMGSGAPVIGILVVFDALEGLSQKPLPWKEPVREGAPGHGCGHNLIAAAACGATSALADYLKASGRSGTIKLFGTPGEEICIGKPFMAREGLFEGLDAVLTWHPAQTVSSGHQALAYDSLRFVFNGVSAYGAQAHLARSALDAAVLMEVIVNFLREHMIPPEVRWSLNSVFVRAGGPSTIPDVAELWYVCWAPVRRYVDIVYEHLLRAANGAAQATATSVTVQRLTGCHQSIINETLSGVVCDVMQQIGTPHFTPEEHDFAKQSSALTGNRR